MSLGTPTYESKQERRKAHIKWAFSIAGFLCMGSRPDWMVPYVVLKGEKTCLIS